MKIKSEIRGSILKICLTGELGHHEAIEAISQIKDELSDGKYLQAVLDLTGLSFMDSSGIAVVMKAYKTAQNADIKLAVKVENGHKKRILLAAGLNKIIDFI
ncbi:MAG: STAS domain-containing protein [Clostridia bacterium]|nr:STAS domain-containing protein [Clostridia bacterium]